MSLTKEFTSLPETKVLLLEVTKGKRKALIEKMIDYFYQGYSTRGRTHQLLEKTFNNYYPLFDYFYNNWEDVEQALPTQNLNPFQKLTHKSSFVNMLKGIGFNKEFNKEEQKIISNSIVFITKLFRSFEQIDPTSNMKYGNWLVDVVFPFVLKAGFFNNRISYDDQANANLVIQEKGTFFEDLPKWESYLKAYHEMKQKNELPDEYKDINKINPDDTNPFGVLNKITKEYRSIDTGDFFEMVEESLIEGDDYKVLAELNGFIIYRPLSQKANSLLGDQTEWCTTYGEYCTNPEYQDRSPATYDNLYILINESDPKEKYQFHFGSDQFMDSEDRRKNINEFLGDHLDIAWFFWEQGEISVETIIARSVNNNSRKYIKKIFNDLKAKEIPNGLGYYINKISSMFEDNGELIIALKDGYDVKLSVTPISDKYLVVLKGMTINEEWEVFKSERQAMQLALELYNRELNSSKVAIKDITQKFKKLFE